MSIDNIIELLRDKLKAEQDKNKCYVQGFEDAIAEAMYLLEKNKKHLSCKPDCTK